MKKETEGKRGAASDLADSGTAVRSSGRTSALP
jgi:hypothetical protein